jgi:hypothetical protein
MAPWNDFVKLVRALRRQGCSESEIISEVMDKYPELCRTVEEAIKKIQDAERKRFNPNEW